VAMHKKEIEYNLPEYDIEENSEKYIITQNY
jgi:hypothetical protein